jgi:putative oxidoreductase
MVGAAHFWAVRNGFFFTASGAELPVVWTVLLLIIALLGDGAYALVPSPAPWSVKPRTA